MKWVAGLYPEHLETLTPWVDAAKAWFKVKRPDIQTLLTISGFIEHYLLKTVLPLGLPVDLNGFLSLGNQRGRKLLPSYYDLAKSLAPSNGLTRNNRLHRFINHVLETRFEARPAKDGGLQTSTGLGNPIPYIHGDGTSAIVRGARKDQDTTLSWVTLRYPHLEPWRAVAAEWLDSQTSGLTAKLTALAKFFDLYLAKQPKAAVSTPATTLARTTQLPEFFEAVGLVNVKRGVVYNNYIAELIDWLLTRDFSEDDDYGRKVLSPAFHNIVVRRSREGSAETSHDSSVRSAMPYGLIYEARKLLVQGPNFKDWSWAQTLLGSQEGGLGAPGRDWFEVPEELLDKMDPDCVYRRRNVGDRREVLEIWSPVRYVALLVKLMLPLRTAQVRVLDSGEADTWRYEYRGGGNWVLNRSALAQGTDRRPLACGVISRVQDSYRAQVDTGLYINTNKTNDRNKGGAAKGYAVPWPVMPDPMDDVYYWLAKLRDWQAKYNPVNRRTSWRELRGKGIINTKHDTALAAYSDACFLFRAPEVLALPHLPLKDSLISGVWERLLLSLQQQLARQGVAHPNGSPIELVKINRRQFESGGIVYTRDEILVHFDLHGLRVSILTSLALEGEVPFTILQKLAGHSRLLMTLYYFKPGDLHVKQVLQAAQDRLNAKAHESTLTWLQNAAHSDLEQRAIAVNAETLLKVIPINPAHRNPAGWMMMGDGICLAGGNTSTTEVNAQIGGCHNGGPNIGKPTQPLYAPVPGGPRNCPRCRWFITAPQFLPALVARFNNTAYHFDQARDEVANYTRRLESLREELHDASASGGVFSKQAELRTAERLLELYIKKFDDRCFDLGAIFRLVKRNIDILNLGSEGKEIVLATDMTGLETAVEETDGELLQLAWICDDVEVYPDLDPGSAVLRRTQLLDMALESNGLPTAFMRLSRDEQLKVGNAFLRRLSHEMNPEDRWAGMRRVVEHLEAGRSISALPGVAAALESIPISGIKLSTKTQRVLAVNRDGVAS